MKHTTSSNELLEFIKKNGDVSEDAFMNIIYECILNKIAYEKCNSLKNDNKIEDFKKRAKMRGRNGEYKTAKDLFEMYDLSESELNYVSSIVISFIYKLDRKSLEKVLYL